MNPLTITLRRFIYTILGKCDMLMGRTSSIIILCYHSIGNDGWKFSVRQDVFEQQMRILSQRYTFIPFSELISFIQNKKKLPRYSCVITFDDGYKNIMDIVPFCKINNIIPMVYVLTDPLHANRETLDNTLPLLTSKDLLVLKKNKFEIGVHTATHSVFSSDNTKELHKEIIDAKKSLEKIIGKKADSFAYPKGRYTKKVLQTVKKAGYTSGVTMDDAVVTSSTDVFSIPRIGVDGTHTTDFAYTYSPSVIQFRKLIKASPLKKYF